MPLRVIASVAAGPLVALAALLALAAPAHATAIRVPAAAVRGPLLVAGEPAYFDGVHVISLTAGRSVVDATYPYGPVPTLVSAQAAVGSRVDVQCDQYYHGACIGTTTITEDELQGALPGAAPVCLEGYSTRDGTSCGGNACGNATPYLYGEVALSATEVAWTSACGGVRVRDLASSDAARAFPGLSRPAISGRWLLASASSSTLELIDLDDGTTKVAVPGATPLGDSVESDGLFAWVQAEKRTRPATLDVLTASPSAPAPRRLASLHGSSGELTAQVAGGLIAIAGPATHGTVYVYDAQGHLVAAQPAPLSVLGAGFAFDGATVVTEDADCAMDFYLLRRVSEPPATLPSDACQAPRATLHGSARRGLTLTLSCPRTASVGCAGSLTAVLRATRCHRRRCAALVVSDPGGTAFELLGGASATASLDPEGQAPRWLRTYAKDAPRLIVRATADRGPTQTAPAQVRRALFRIS